MKNWKVIMMVLALAGTVQTASAQLYLGPKGGVSLNTVSGNTPAATDKKMTLGYQFGAALNYQFGNVFSLQPEVLYLKKGVRYESTITDDFAQRATSYLEVPILAKAQLGGEKFKGYAVLGPYVGYWVGGKTTASVLGVETDDSIDFDNDLDDDGYRHNRIDLGLSGGLGMQYTVWKGNIFLDARYGFGLFDTNKYETEPDGYKTVANRNIQVSIGYMFRLSKDS